MRRVSGLLLVGVGMFALVLALMVKLYAEPRLLRVPLDQSSSTTSLSDGSSTVLDRGTVSIRTGLTLRANREVRGVVDGSKDDAVAVWHTASSLLDPAGKPVSVTEEVVAFDRTSGLAVNCCDEQLNGDRTVKHEGLVFKFPFGAEKKEYPFWDATAGKAFPARFVAAEKKNGLDVYHYQSQIPATTIGSAAVPPSLVKQTGDQAIQTSIVYTNTRDLWVEPISGIIVEGREQPEQVLQGQDGAALATVFQSNIGYTPQTVAKAVDDAKAAAGKVFLVRLLLPVALLVLGALMLLAGVLLLLRDRPRPGSALDGDADDDGPEAIDLRDGAATTRTAPAGATDPR